MGKMGKMGSELHIEECVSSLLTYKTHDRYVLSLPDLEKVSARLSISYP